MIIIKAKSANEAWLKAFQHIWNEGLPTDNKKYIRDEPTLIEITDPTIEKVDKRFPMAQTEIDTINHFICTGENEAAVNHEWTKIYYHRAFDEPHSQIEFLIQKLQESEPTGEAQISMWDKMIDQTQRISPCTQIVWARIKHDKLELHVHAHSSDAYKKLLMNINEFIAMQHYIAKRIDKLPGNYYHFIDSCHLHGEDLESIQCLLQAISGIDY